MYPKMEEKCVPYGSLLEASWGGLGGLLGALGAVLETSWALLGVSWALLRRSWRHLEGHKAPEREAKRVQNRVQEATRAENVIYSKSLVFNIIH